MKSPLTIVYACSFGLFGEEFKKIWQKLYKTQEQRENVYKRFHKKIYIIILFMYTSYFDG